MTPSFLVLALAACSGEPVPAEISAPVEAAAPTPVATGPSLVLITLDTTRADRIGAYGYEHARTPVIDSMAQQGLLFERAYAPMPLTTPSHATMLSGLYPPRHGIRNNGDAILSDDVTTLAEHLSAAGYRSAASVSAFVTTRVWNLDQGFDTYFDDVQKKGRGRWGQERPAAEVVDDLVGWLADPEAGTGPFFLWAHFYDPHDPHLPPEGFTEGFPHPYDGEIAYVDAQMGRLRDAVDAAAGADGAHWIVVADHGEAFDREHGEVTHGLFVFDPTMRVPFIVKPATPLPEPVVRAEPTVSGVDVMPTALGLLGLPVPTGLDGADLSGATTAEITREPVYMEALSATQRFGYHPEIAAVEGAYKLMDTPDARLYQVDDDPGELTNLLGQHPEVEARLRAKAQEVWASEGMAEGEAPAPEVIEQLAALGYMSNDFDMGSEAAEIDAKTRLDTITRLENLRKSSHEGRELAEVEADYKALIAAEPQIAEARMGLAGVLSRQGRDAEAEQVYREALERQPDSALLRVNLSNAIAAQGRLEEALTMMKQVLLQVPGDNLAQVGVLRMLTDLDREEEAAQLARGWLAGKPDDAGIQAHLGIILAQLGQFDEAERRLRASLKDEVPRQLVHQALAVFEVRRGRPKMALMHYEKELKYFGGKANLYSKVGDLHMGLREWEDAAKAYEGAATRKPDDVAARRAWAQAVFNMGEYAEAASILAPAVAAAPDDPDVLLLHANVLAKVGDRTEAEAVAARANALHKARVERLQREGPPGGLPPGAMPPPLQGGPPPGPAQVPEGG